MIGNKKGVIHGRFQGLHLGHMEYLLEAFNRCDFLYIGISNPDPILSKVDTSDLKRGKKSSNPFSYFHRLHMIEGSLNEEGIDQSKFTIVPFPISFPNLLQFYVPADATYFITIYDQWGEKKHQTLQSLGLKTEVMWRRSMSERFTTGTEVRRRILIDETWDELVPKFVHEYIMNNDLDMSLKQ